MVFYFYDIHAFDVFPSSPVAAYIRIKKKKKERGDWISCKTLLLHSLTKKYDCFNLHIRIFSLSVINGNISKMEVDLTSSRESRIINERVPIIFYVLNFYMHVCICTRVVLLLLLFFYFLFFLIKTYYMNNLSCEKKIIYSDEVSAWCTCGGINDKNKNMAMN